MAQRPKFIDLRMDSSASVNTTASRPLRSPRLHVAGEVPPTLSPLDAFVQQSRNLQRQLEESTREGNRISRLPPLTTESPLVVQARSEYFRSFSYDSSEEREETNSPQTHGGLGFHTEVESPSERPVSMHPRMSRIPPTPDESIPVPTNPYLEQARGRTLGRVDETDGVFGARREQSPSDLDALSDRQRELDIAGDRSTRDISPIFGRSPQSPDKLTKTTSHESTTLIPPRSLFPKRSSSIMSAPPETVSEEALASSFHSQPGRKMSNSSAFSAHPATSPFAHLQRSPSISSDISAPLPRPSFNFSRPLSRAGTPGLEGPPRLDVPSRQASSDSQPSFVLADETAHTPVSMHSEAFLAEEDGRHGSPHTNPRYNLPRGKSLQRNSAIFQDAEVPSSSWDQTLDSPAKTQPFAKSGQAPPSPPTRPSTSSSRYEDSSMTNSLLLARPSGERSKLSNEMSADDGQLPAAAARPSTASGVPDDANRGRSLSSSAPGQARGRTPASVATTDSASTIKPPKSSHGVPLPAADISAEEHREKGIKCHEEGSVKESTYHLRLAARGGDPTGMLLYALACRHGWGMRPNQREGVEWLRKAADVASAEIADDEGQAKDGKVVDIQGSKARKAQFALSIYELGVSHMNGWGIEQDKALALRCFEIAGSWGDVDALTEAGFCYAKGVGCKKDLKKSAKFYRLAEAKGVVMPGNSWIHKDKYTDDDSSIKSRARSKSKSRGIWSKKSKDVSA